MGERTRIVILGGGFGGLYTAMELEKRLARAPDVDVTLVNRENFISFTPMLHEVAASDLDMTHIVTVLERTKWRIEGPDGAARILNVNPSTLRSRIKKLGIQRRPYRSAS